MPLGMKNNIASINAINHLEKAQKEMSDSLTRLASGQRINSGKDSPEGLIMSEGLRAQIVSVKQALQNTEFSLSMVQTAEGALVEVNNLLIEMRQLATNAANEGANDHNTMLELQYQIRSAIEGIDRVSQFTSFGNKNLLDGTYGTKGVEGNENLLFIKGTTDTVSSPPFSGYEVNITELPKKAVLVEKLDDVSASGLNITLEEEDGAIIKVEYTENGTAEGLVNRLKKAAFETNSCFWDMYLNMGGKNSIQDWVNEKPSLASRDYIHFTNSGAKKIADYFIADFMVDYKNYLKAKND